MRRGIRDRKADGRPGPIKFNSMKKLVFCCLSGALLLAASSLATSCKGKDNTAVLPRSLSLSKTELSLLVGDTYSLEATVLPQEASDTKVVWSSTKSQRVSVDKDGLVHALAVGSAYIVAETVNGLKASCLVRVSASDVPTYSLSLWMAGAAAPATLYSWPGSTAQLEVRSSDDKAHTWFWNSSSAYTSVHEGLVTFGWGEDPVDGYAWYSEAVISVSSEDGCASSVNVVSSIGRSFRFGAASESIGSNVVILAGTSSKISLMWFDGNAFTPIPDEAYTLKSQDPSILAVEGHTVSSTNQLAGSTTLSVLLNGREFLLCNVIVEKDGSRPSSGEQYTSEPVIW